MKIVLSICLFHCCILKTDTSKVRLGVLELVVPQAQAPATTINNNNK